MAIARLARPSGKRAHAESIAFGLVGAAISRGSRCRDIRALDGRYAFETLERTNPEGIAHSAARVLPAGTVVALANGLGGLRDDHGPADGDEPGLRELGRAGKTSTPEFLMHLFIRSRERFRSLSAGAVHQTVYFPTRDGAPRLRAVDRRAASDRRAAPRATRRDRPREGWSGYPTTGHRRAARPRSCGRCSGRTAQRPVVRAEEIVGHGTLGAPRRGCSGGPEPRRAYRVVSRASHAYAATYACGHTASIRGACIVRNF